MADQKIPQARADVTFAAYQEASLVALEAFEDWLSTNPDLADVIRHLDGFHDAMNMAVKTWTDRLSGKEDAP